MVFNAIRNTYKIGAILTILIIFVSEAIYHFAGKWILGFVFDAIFYLVLS